MSDNRINNDDGGLKVDGHTWANQELADEARLQKQSRQVNLDMFKLQQKAHQDNQLITTKSSIEKAKHDAIMNMANNIK